MTCAVCDQEGDELPEVRGFLMHESCAPAGWVKEQTSRRAFMEKVYDLAPYRAERWRKMDR